MPQPEPPWASERPLHLAFVGAGLLGFAVLVVLVREFVTDDAYISARYARNLADGFGPVWNPEGPRVEGYGNPLLVLFEALFFRMRMDGLLAARGLGVVCAFVAVVSVWRLGRDAFGPFVASASALITGLTPAMAFWAVGGLETQVAVVSVTTATLALARSEPRHVLAGSVLCPLPWLRPEGVAVAVTLALASEAAALADGRTRRDGLRRAALIAGPTLLAAGLLLALRVHWFGHTVPNSAIYKLVADAPGSVTLRFAGQAAPLLPLVVLGAARLRRREWIAGAPMLLYVVGSFATVNSVNAFSRFMLPTWPLWVIVSVLGISRAVRPRAQGIATLAVVTLAAILVGTQTGSAVSVVSYARHYATCKTTVRQDAAGWLRTHLQRGRLFAIGDAGLVPYAAPQTAFDLFSLNDPVLQESGRPSPELRARQTLQALPDVVLTSARTPDLAPQYPVEQALLAHPDFSATYEPSAAFQRPSCDYHLRAWRRRAKAPAATGI